MRSETIHERGCQRRHARSTDTRPSTASALHARLAAVIAGVLSAATLLAASSASAQIPASCPADPVAEMQNIQVQMDAVHAQATDIKKNQLKLAKQDLADQGPGAAALRIQQIEEQIIVLETQATQLLAAMLEINRCCFRSGKYVIWIEIERLTVLIKKTYIKIIVIERFIWQTFWRLKLRIQKLTTNVHCCQCNGVPNPPITGCASTVGLLQTQCSVACLPFAWSGQYFTSSMCDAQTGNCIPDP